MYLTKHTRDFTYIDDIVAGVIKAIDSQQKLILNGIVKTRSII